jgi:hypothetical protein
MTTRENGAEFNWQQWHTQNIRSFEVVASVLPLFFFFQKKAYKKSAVSCGQKSRRANPIIRFEKRKIGIGFFFSPSGIYQKGRSLWARYKNTAGETSSKNRSQCHRSIQVSGHSWVSKWPVCGYTVCPFLFFFLVARPSSSMSWWFCASVRETRLPMYVSYTNSWTWGLSFDSTSTY